nr:MAG TPA: SatD family (SatD) [Caudoviricetes sp.]
MDRWTQDQKDFLIKNVKVITVEQIATALHKSEVAVRLYCYRNGIVLRKTLDKAIVPELMRIKFGHPAYFRPSREFYGRVKMSQKRFSQLKQGIAQPTQAELTRLSREWNVTVPESLSLMGEQLSLFNE